MLFGIRTSLNRPDSTLVWYTWHWQLLDLNSFDCKVLHYVLKCVLRKIRAAVLSEDKAQDKGKCIIVVICYFCCQIFIQLCINENTFLAVLGVCMNESKCQLNYIAFWPLYCAKKWAYSYSGHWNWCMCFSEGLSHQLISSLPLRVFFWTF